MTQENHDLRSQADDGIQSINAVNHGYLIWTGDFKNGTVIGTVPCGGSICGGLPVCKVESTGNAT